MPASTAIAELQQKLFKRIGVELPERQQQQPQWRQNKSSKGIPSSKSAKKSDRYSGRTALDRYPSQQSSKGDQNFQQPRFAFHKVKDSENHFVKSPDEDDNVGDLEQDSFGSDGEDAESEEDGDVDEDDEEIESSKDTTNSKTIPSAVREGLAQDDAEIDEFERKLGIKKGRQSLPQAFKDDGLDELLEDLGGNVSDEEDDETLKRKRDYDDWLSAKRRKMKVGSRQIDQDIDSVDMSDGSEDDGDDDLELVEGEDEQDATTVDDQSFNGFESDADVEQPQKRVKENPYKAPTTGAVVAKYVPPSLRKVQSSESEAKVRLQKQIQGQINRLTEANILSIVQAIEELYQKNARGDVTEQLTVLIFAQIQKPDSLPDQFFVLTGGFSAAIYKVIGSSFGSHLVREVVKTFGEVYETCDKEEGDPSAIRKEASNMIGFLTQLYLFEVVNCRIMFDYMERLLEDLSELNVELLLRICRMAGRSLRKDDPNALKHVTSILGTAVAKVGYANVSARTKFMIETLNNLKNSKPKARGLDSTIVSDHVLLMRKRLGELKSQSRRLDGLAPMGVGLDDIEKADTAGKWWLVGASVPVKETKGDSKSTPKIPTNDSANLSDNEDMDFVLPDYPKKARAQGLNTMAQIAIFTAIMSAMSYEHGYRQYVGLGLKRDDQLEIARVLVQCVGSEAQYNEYYALLGKKACINAKIKFAFQDRLWRIFRSLGESMFGEEAEVEETADSERMKDERRISYVTRFYASFMADGVMSIHILKPLNLPEMNQQTSLFVEWLMINLLRACRGKGSKEAVRVQKVFGAAAELPSLAAGILWFLKKKIRKTKLISVEEVKKLERVREKAQAAVQGELMAEDNA
ncbi:Suppressor of glycerol defect protein 1 [Cladobotryum mycophilum]|uniref:Suppressor of glycerol defect protein 1 n=1 Tax=Cladobotryum mycophilum TaxID=491253 RepID=A0ABR0SV55_9HYPO